MRRDLYSVLGFSSTQLQSIVLIEITLTAESLERIVGAATNGPK
jgi:hypothetical protein